MIPLFKVFMSDVAIKNAEMIMRSGYIGQGEVVNRFEAALSQYIGNPLCVTTNSATAALHLALRLIDVKDREVISTPLTMPATNLAILLNGGIIKWADTDFYGNIDPHSVEKAITNNTAAIMCVDWGGVPCPTFLLGELGREYGIPIIEDAAQAFGASARMGKVGTVSDFTVFSFQAIKVVTCIDGGALFLKNEELYKKAKLMRWFGMSREGPDRNLCSIEYPGDKLHMNDVNAAVGLGNLPYATDHVIAARYNAEYYHKELEGCTSLPPKIPGASWWFYQILVDRREDFIKYMAEKGVQTWIVDNRNDRHPLMLEKFGRVILPRLSGIDLHRVAIPVGWWVTNADREYIADTIKKGW